MKNVKLLALVVAVMMIVSLATACGSSSTGSKPAESTAAPASTAVAPATTAAEPATTTAAPASTAAAGKYKDGTYKVEYDKFDSKGWKGFVEITIAGDKITAVKYDFVNKDGKFKSQDAAYEKAMKDKNGVGPAEYTKSLADSLVAKQDPKTVDTVTGATASSKDFVQLATVALTELAPAGTASKVIPLPAGE